MESRGALRERGEGREWKGEKGERRAGHRFEENWSPSGAVVVRGGSKIENSQVGKPAPQVYCSWKPMRRFFGGAVGGAMSWRMADTNCRIESSWAPTFRSSSSNLPVSSLWLITN